MSLTGTLPELDFETDVPEISPEVMSLLDQPSTLARRSEVRSEVLGWGFQFHVARTVFVPWLGENKATESPSGTKCHNTQRMVVVRDHPSLERHRRVVSYAFGPGPVRISLLPMTLMGLNYCRKCQSKSNPHVVHNDVCVARSNFSTRMAPEVRAQFAYSEYRCSVSPCTVCDAVCSVHQKMGPCRLCACYDPRGCPLCYECNGIRCENAARHNILIQEKLCTVALEAQYSVEQGLVLLLRNTRGSDACTDTLSSMNWMFEHLAPSEFHLGGGVWYWALLQESGNTAMTALVALLRYQKRTDPQWILQPSTTQELCRAIKNERAMEFENIRPISQLVLDLYGAAHLDTEAEQLRATDEIIREM